MMIGSMATQPSISRPVGASSQKPTKARYWVVVFAVTLAVLSYIDRVCISQAAPIITSDLGLTKSQMGYIFSSFAVAYALFEIPGGWMGDWMGPRKVLMRIVHLVVHVHRRDRLHVEFPEHVGGSFPVWRRRSRVLSQSDQSFSVWLPQGERVRAQGIMWTFARWGGAFTPPLVVATFALVSWRWAFVIFGALGAIWAAFFYAWFRDNPRDHKSVNAAELALLEGSEELASGHGDVPWGKLIRSRSIWLLWAQYFCLSYPWYFFITWLPTFLKEPLSRR